MSNESTRHPEVAAWNRLARLYQGLSARSEQNFREDGLNTAWFDVLVRVGAHEGQTQNELAQSLLVTKGNISQLVTKLVGEGLLQRDADGRSQRLRLTEVGRRLVERARPRQEALLVRSLGGLTPEEIHTLLRLLRKWEITWPSTASTT